MKLLNCKIVNFGCLSDCSFVFDEGLNLLFAENGKGKSTFAAFLKAMLYGLPSNRKGGLENERRRYTPWQGGTFGGALCFEADGVEYRLERFFGAKEKDDRFALYHLATGNPSTKYGENIGEELFGVDADGFERSLYISQSAPHLPPDNNSIRARLGSLLDASEDLGSFEEADKLLDEARRHYRVQGERGLIPELSLAIREKEAEIAAAREAEATALAIAEERAAIEAKKAEMAKALDEVKTKRIGAEKRRLWDEQNAAYSSLVELKEGAKRQMVPFEEFFAPHLPTDEELFEADGAATECATLTAQYEHATLTAEDNAALEHFRARVRISNGSVFPAMLGGAQECCSARQRPSRRAKRIPSFCGLQTISPPKRKRPPSAPPPKPLRRREPRSVPKTPLVGCAQGRFSSPWAARFLPCLPSLYLLFPFFPWPFPPLCFRRLASSFRSWV